MKTLKRVLLVAVVLTVSALATDRAVLACCDPWPVCPPCNQQK